jgi:hypothetical protein
MNVLGSGTCEGGCTAVKLSADKTLINALLRPFKKASLLNAPPFISTEAEKLPDTPAVKVISKRKVPLSNNEAPLVPGNVISSTSPISSPKRRSEVKSEANISSAKSSKRLTSALIKASEPLSIKVSLPCAWAETE